MTRLAIRMFIQQRYSRHDLARGTKSALKAVMSDEGSLHGMQFTLLRKTFDCFYPVAVVHGSQGQAGIDPLSVDHQGTGTALTVITTLFGSGQAQMIADEV